MKNELMQVWYRVAFMVTENGERREYSIFTQGSSETSAAVSAVVGLINAENGLSHPTFKSIRIATNHESQLFDAELAAIAEQEEKELEEEGDE